MSRALDAALAEMVGETELLPEHPEAAETRWFVFDGDWFRETVMPDGRKWVEQSSVLAYSTDPAASAELRRWVREGGGHYVVAAVPDGATAQVGLGDRPGQDGSADHENEPMAFALAAYQARYGKAWSEPGGSS